MGSPVTFLPTLSLLHPSILDLEPGTEQTDVQTDDGSQCIMPGPPYWGGGITSLPRGSFSLNLQENYISLLYRGKFVGKQINDTGAKMAKKQKLKYQLWRKMTQRWDMYTVPWYGKLYVICTNRHLRSWCNLYSGGQKSDGSLEFTRRDRKFGKMEALCGAYYPNISLNASRAQSRHRKLP